ncbi:unnamed protein product [Rodentolepis nana]|uniref:CUB domain-containing protein n=1 Tax=Rodentolepis nana TaxID=102285 RepID=A0A158QJ29_RODNA|nr:unnamed protein product [Rodentolepis nana]
MFKRSLQTNKIVSEENRCLIQFFLFSAPLASLESIPHEDLSDSSVYRRFFSPEADISPIKAADPPIEPLSRIPHTSPPDSKSRTYKFSMALKDAARMFRFSSTSSPIGQQEDAITLEDGTTLSSTLPQGSECVGSQTRLFKQQKKPRKISAALGGMSSGSRIGRKSKNSTTSQDTGHCNAFEVAQEIEEMESSVDNDRFLHSLESAVFTPSVNLTGGSNNTVPSRYSSSSTLNDGDLAELNGHSAVGPIHLSLPPGSPVIGFAYLGLGDVQEEDDFVQRIDDKGSQEAINPNGSASTVGTDVARASTPPVDNEIRLLNRNKVIGQPELDNNHYNSSDSATSATAMLPTSRGLGQSISASHMDLRPLSTNMETWLVASDEHLLISPTGEGASRLQKGAAHPMRSVSSNDMYKNYIDFTARDADLMMPNSSYYCGRSPSKTFLKNDDLLLHNQIVLYFNASAAYNLTAFRRHPRYFTRVVCPGVSIKPSGRYVQNRVDNGTVYFWLLHVRASLECPSRQAPSSADFQLRLIQWIARSGADYSPNDIEEAYDRGDSSHLPGLKESESLSLSCTSPQRNITLQDRVRDLKVSWAIYPDRFPVQSENETQETTNQFLAGFKDIPPDLKIRIQITSRLHFGGNFSLSRKRQLCELYGYWCNGDSTDNGSDSRRRYKRLDGGGREIGTCIRSSMRCDGLPDCWLDDPTNSPDEVGCNTRPPNDPKEPFPSTEYFNNISASVSPQSNRGEFVYSKDFE